jgi:hypothetical protein
MAEEAVKLPGTTIIHYLNELAERTLVGLQANCSKDQIRHIGGMALGEAVVHITRTIQPVKVKVRHFGELVPGGVSGKTWTDKAVAERMRETFAKHPELVEWVEPPQSLVAEIFGLQAQGLSCELGAYGMAGLDPSIVADLIDATQDSFFVGAYDITMESALNGRVKQTALSIRDVVREYVKDKSKLREYCEYMVWYLSRQKNDPAWRAAHEAIRQCLEAELGIQEGV